MRSLQKQKGSLLLEFFIVITLIGIFAPMLMPNWTEIAATRLSDATVEDSLTIWDASRNYYARNAAWPDEANNCADAISVLDADGFIGGVTGTNNWGEAITTTCVPGDAAMIITQGTNPEWQSYIVNALPASEAGAGSDVETLIPAPGTAAQTQSQLSRIAVAGRPELNQMETDLDMNGNDIDGANQITSENVIVNEDLTHATTGISFSEMGRWKLYNYSSAFSGSNFVPAPSCPATNPTPNWLATPKQICTNPSGTLPMESWWFEATSVAGGWRIRPAIFANNNVYRPTAPACSQFYVHTYCE